ncbi:MAG: hypothetical protein H6842_11280 [Rhodospirillaceae bacterium]|nr:hypothetical protein [Rhodospirillaceae bacterium]
MTTRGHIGAVIGSAILALSVTALAQPVPPLGEWAEAGDWCVGGVAVTVPEGVEAISYGAGVELRTVDGIELGELIGPATNGVPTLEGFADRLSTGLDCGGEDSPQVSGPSPLADAAVVAQAVTIACRGAAGTHGAAIAAAPIPLEGEEKTATLFMPFGDAAFTLGRHSITAGAALSEDRLMPVFTAIAQSLRPCRETP